MSETAKFKVPEKCEGCSVQAQFAEEIGNIEKVLESFESLLQVYTGDCSSELKESTENEPLSKADEISNQFKKAFLEYRVRLEDRLKILKENSAKYADGCGGTLAYEAAEDNGLTTVPRCNSEEIYLAQESKPTSQADVINFPYRAA